MTSTNGGFEITLSPVENQGEEELSWHRDLDARILETWALVITGRDDRRHFFFPRYDYSIEPVVRRVGDERVYLAVNRTVAIIDLARGEVVALHDFETPIYQLLTTNGDGIVVAETGVHRLARDGLSVQSSVYTDVITSITPAESELRLTFLDDPSATVDLRGHRLRLI